MKVFLLFAFCLLTFTLCHSQITITQADMPNAGDTLRVSYSTDAIDPSFTDSTCAIDGFVWDYSYLTPNAQWLRKFDSPTTFTFPFNVIFNPINTSYGEAQYTVDSIPLLGIKPDDAYNFYKESSTKWRQIGTGLTLNGLPLSFTYNPHDTIYRFPMNCGDQNTSDAVMSPSISIGYYYGQFIHRENFVDGRGTLITPYGYFPALRVKSIIAIRDTFADSSGTFGFAFDRPLSYEFKWLVNGGKIPYLEVNATDIGGTPVVNQISYRDSMRGVAQIGIEEFTVYGLQFTVYPNPATEYAFLHYELSSSAEIGIDLFDISGRKVKSITEGKQTAGKHLEIVNVKELSPQIYFVKLSSGNQIVTRKLSVMR